MLRNYFRTAWRNFTNNKGYSAINIAGLAIGMAVALLIGLWVINEYSYDRFLPNSKQLYKVKFTVTSQHDGTRSQDAICLPLADVLRHDIPGIKRVAESDFVGSQSHSLVVGDKKLYLKGGAVGSAFLSMFRYPLVKGNAEQVLQDPFSIVINQSTATALFGDTDPINKTIRVDNQHDVKVTGVLKDVPANSSLQFSYLLPFSYNQKTQDWVKQASTMWVYNSFQLFVELQDGVPYARVAPLIKDLVYQHSPEMRVAKPQISLQPLQDWHLYSDFKNGKAVDGFIDYVRMFSIVGALVLLIACINFMNLSTARSEKRAREVGVRKAIGSQRRDLIFQFLAESVFVTLLSFILSIVLVQLALPAFNTLTGNAIGIPYNNPLFWCCMIGYVLVTGLLAGSRPAFYLSSFNPVKVLKGTIQVGRAAALPRKALVVLQFSCSVALIISTIVVYRQIQYAKDRPTGYSADRLVTTDMSDDLNNHYDALKHDLLQTGVVENVARASSPATGVSGHMALTDWPGKAATDEMVGIGAIFVSDSYFKTLGMQLLAGRDFSTSWDADTTNLVLNETAVKRLGLKDPIGQEITWNGSQYKMRIIGVVKDALMESPFTPVEPVVFAHGRRGRYTIYRLSAAAGAHEAMEKIGKVFDQYNPAYPFSYKFVDDEYDHKFNLEVLVGKLAGIFAVLAIFISCLGLFGLAAYVAEQRTKEIGIRKVLVASVPQVWLLLSKEFIALVLISCIIASPVALYYLQGWLEKYSYRITLGPGVFIAASIVAIVITVITVSFQSVKAAIANPVKSLRTE